MSFSTGARLGPYEVVSLLGAGGMGEVYRARDTRLDRLVALKVVRPGLASDEAFRERFHREARVISRLSHPNICALFDIGEQDGTPYLVMEYLEGTTLGEHLAAKGQPALDEVLSYAIQIADALAAAHGTGIVHRDLKPGNVMLLDAGRVKLLDFGLAKTVASDDKEMTTAQLSMAGQVVGTVAYMSPEQARGEPVDQRSDIFSCGVLLYELASGVRPFQGSTSFSILHKINAEEPPRLHNRAPALPEALSTLVQRMLEKSPERRPSSMTEVATELRAIASARGLAVASALGPALGQSLWRWPSRARRAFVVGAIAVATVAAMVVLVPGMPWRRGDPVPEGSVTLPRTAFDWVSQGRAYLRRFDRSENVDRAIQAYQQAVQLEPDHAFAQAGLAEALVRKNVYVPDQQWVRQATEAATRAVQLNPDLAAAHAALGLVQLQAKQIESGVASFGRALQLDKGLLQAHLWQGESRIATGDLANAEQSFRTAVQLAPGEWNPHELLGRVLYRQAKYGEAARSWEEAQRITPDNTLVLRSLGAAYHMLNRLDDAAAAFQRALEIEPTASVYSNLGTLRFFQGQYTAAASAFERAVSLNATYYLYWANLGDAYRWVPGQTAKSREAYSRAIALVRERLGARPQDPDLQSQLALYLAKTDAKSGALEEVERWNQLPKKTAASQFRAVVVHELTGERAAALQSLEAALEGGYSLEEVRTEPELVKLRADPKYQRLVAGFESRTTR